MGASEPQNLTSESEFKYISIMAYSACILNVYLTQQINLDLLNKNLKQTPIAVTYQKHVSVKEIWPSKSKITRNDAL